MKEKVDYLGFGFNPLESRHHFLVCVSEAREGSVLIYERLEWQDEEEIQKINDYAEDTPKARISKHKWRLLEETVRSEFNTRLKKKKKEQEQKKTASGENE